MPEDEAGLAWEMLEWEVHHWRAAFGVALMRAQLHARKHPDDKDIASLTKVLLNIKEHMAEAQLEALMNTAKRRGRTEE